jgi:hypothetical protein
MGAKSYGWKEVGDDFAKASKEVVEQGKKIVGQGCLNIKKDAQRIIRANSPRGYLPHYPRAISYEVTGRTADIVGEIGPDAAKLQGGLGRIIEFGTVNNAPIPHLVPALDAELPRFEQHVADFAADLIVGQQTAGGPVEDPG